MSDARVIPVPLLPPREGESAPGARGATAPSPRVEDRTARSHGAAERPVDRPVAREAVRQAVAQAVVQEARTRLADARRFGTAEGGEALDAPSPELRRLLGQLRSTVTAYVLARRTAGVPIERVVPEAKCLVREAESCEAWRDPSDVLLSQVVRWGIEAYYDDPSLQQVPRFY